MPTYNVTTASINQVGTSGWQNFLPKWNDAWVHPRWAKGITPNRTILTKQPRQGLNLTIDAPWSRYHFYTRYRTSEPMRMGTVNRLLIDNGRSQFNAMLTRSGTVTRHPYWGHAGTYVRAMHTRLGSVPRGEVSSGAPRIRALSTRDPRLGINLTINVSSYGPAILKPRALTADLPEMADVLGTLQTSIEVDQTWLTYIASIPVVLPSPPVTPTPGVIPAAGGVIVRALYGKVVDMNTPTIVDGKPT